MRTTEEPGTRRDNLVFDWDGVLHEHPDYRVTFGDIDLSPIALAHERGLAVSVMTCNDIGQVADVLRRGGYRVYADFRMSLLFWGGGRSGTEVLVTGRKVAGIGYLDDRGHNATYGCDFGDLIDTVLASADARRMSRR